MEQLVNLFVLIPLLGFIIGLVIPSQKEGALSKITYLTIGIQLIVSLVFIGWWIWNGSNVINLKEFSIFKTVHYDFYIDLYFDKISATYILIGAVLTFLITVYSLSLIHI